MENLIHIFLADDDADDRSFFADAFNTMQLRFNLKMFKDGEELMEHLKVPENILPSIVFLDLNMPRKNGIECLKEIRENPRLKNLSVAIYSTSSNAEDIHDTFVLGANIYITKPSNFKELIRVLHKVVTVNWQFHTDNLNKETFLMTI